MIIIMQKSATEEQISYVMDEVRALGFGVHLFRKPA